MPVNIKLRMHDHMLQRVIVGPEKPLSSPAEPALDELPHNHPFRYTKHRFAEAFRALRGQQLTGELSFAQATNVLLEDIPPVWTALEQRAVLRLSLQDAAKDTPVFDMSDVVVYIPTPDSPQVPDFQRVFLVNADATTGSSPTLTLPGPM